MAENNRNNETELSRDKQIVRTSFIGIAANVLLAGFKAAVGLLSNSIAIILDAVNNISDAASSIITVIGTKLAGKAPDKKHPFGYGRIEYLSAMIISLIVLYAGVTSFTESIQKIIEPETPEYTIPTLIIIGVAVVVKIVLGRYVKSVGVRTNSESLINSGEDAVMDSVISASTLAAAIIYLIWNVSLEAWLGAIISAVIIKSGIEMLMNTISELLGEKADAELARGIRETVEAYPEVEGSYDLILNNYGPDRFNGSIHIEIPDTCTVNRVDELTREITTEVYAKYNVLLTGIGIYSVNTKDETLSAIRSAINDIIAEEKYITGLHGLAKNSEKSIRADIVVSLDAPDRAAVFGNAMEKIKAKFPEYDFTLVMDTDFTEE